MPIQKSLVLAVFLPFALLGCPDKAADTKPDPAASAAKPKASAPVPAKAGAAAPASSGEGW